MSSTGRRLNSKRIYINAILFLVSLLAAGCVTTEDVSPVRTANPGETPQALSSSTPASAPTDATMLTPTQGVEEGSFVVTINTGESFEAEVRGHGSTAIILANMSSGDGSQWAPLYENLDKDKYVAITYPWLYETFAVDQTKALLEYLRSAGFERVICIGASLGVGACGSLADQPEIIGLVFIAGPAKHKLDDIDVPKLFISGQKDGSVRYTQLDYKLASEPKEIVLIPTNEHGTELFGSDYGDEFLDLLLNFIDETAATAP